jgi:Ni,Fe-hydrogenase III large subunit/Ni,Fe-hydrogenase III component G
MNIIMENIKKYIPQNAKTESFGNATIFEVSTAEIISLANNLNNNESLELKLITAIDERKERGCFRIWYIFGAPRGNLFIIPYIELKNTEEFPSLTPSIHKAWNWERKIQTFFGLKPVGHPDSRPIVLHENWPNDVFPLRKDFNWQERPKQAQGEYQFQKVDGEGIYEIPVGPIHAGIIEPGHFRFSVAGEEILLLEPKLGYVHKGSEKLFEQLLLADKLRLSEKISGDSSFSHSLAFCQGIEELSNTAVPARAQYLRVIYAELERLANHFGDIGAIMVDAGFNFGGANGARIREMIMQINERLTGSRFLRGVNAIGGVTKDIKDNENNKLSADLENIIKDFSEVIDIAENSASLLNRLKGTGVLPLEVAKNHGVTGVAARSVGIAGDARADYPYLAYDKLGFSEVESEADGDVYARFRIRIKEAFSSTKIIQKALKDMPRGAICACPEKITLKKKAVSINIVEGWRGEILYFIVTDGQGNISRVVPFDPSFMNWQVLGLAGVGNIVPDFPLINKSFNLSYSGNDL